MSRQTAAAQAEVVRRALADGETAWSIGTLGATAEFLLVDDDPPPLIALAPCGGSIVSGRGGVRVALVPDVRALAYEQVGAGPGAWIQSFALCLPRERAAMGARTTLTALGLDTEALLADDRRAMLFDLGLGIGHIDVCVRTAEPALLDLLTAAVGRPLGDGDGHVVEALKRASPHRVFRSALGRIEVRQPIASARRRIATPVGPHTHLHFGSDAVRLSHPADVPIEDGWVPALMLYPGSPIADRFGRPRPFDNERHLTFQELIERFGPPGYMEEKILVTTAVVSGAEPRGFGFDHAPWGRGLACITLRQMRHTHPTVEAVDAWLAAVGDASAGRPAGQRA